MLKADEKVKRKLVPVKSWDTLNMNSVYLVKSVHEMEISLKSGEEKQPATFVSKMMTKT